MTLNDFMMSELFAFLLIFCRIGTAMMTLPGFGEAYVSVRFRLLLAVMLSIVLTPGAQNFPAPPESVLTLVTMMSAELLVGIFLGMTTRMLIAAVSTAGMIIAYQSSLASALVQDVTMAGGQGTSLGNFFGLSALVLIFSTDLHHMLLRTLHDSYMVFSVGQFPNVADLSEHTTQMMNKSFLLSLQLASPYIVVGLVFYLAGGIIARLMPSMQVFAIIVAPQLMISFFLMMITFNAIMMWYLDYFRDSLSPFMGD